MHELLWTLSAIFKSQIEMTKEGTEKSTVHIDREFGSAWKRQRWNRLNLLLTETKLARRILRTWSRHKQSSNMNCDALSSHTLPNYLFVRICSRNYFERFHSKKYKLKLFTARTAIHSVTLHVSEEQFSWPIHEYNAGQRKDIWL